MYLHLKELRETLGMTQEEFGKSIGVAKSTYNNYEKGIREPKSDFWIAVAKKYGVTIDYLMGYTDDPHRTTSEVDSIKRDKDRPLTELEREIIETFLKLDDRARSAALGYINRLVEEMRNKPSEQIPMDVESQLEHYRHGMLIGIAAAQADYSLPLEDINIDSITLSPELKAMVDSKLEEQRRILESEHQKGITTIPAADGPGTPQEGAEGPPEGE